MIRELKTKDCYIKRVVECLIYKDDVSRRAFHWPFVLHTDKGQMLETPALSIQ